MYIVKSRRNLTNKPSKIVENRQISAKIVEIVKNHQKSSKTSKTHPLYHPTYNNRTRLPHPTQARYQKIRICLFQIGYHYNRGSWNEVLSIIAYMG